MCPSSGEITVSMRHWYLSLCMGGVWSAGWSETPTSPCAHHQEKLLYLCDTGICHSVWVASGLLVGVKLQPAHVPIIRRNYCIYATLVFVTLYGWRLVCWLE